MNWIPIFLTIVGFAGIAQDQPDDWRILPGERVGPINSSTTESDLRRIFGDGAVVPVDVHRGEGVTVPGTAVYPKIPDARIEVVWRSSKRVSPKEVRITGATSKWETHEGISLGMTLMQVEALNGYPFRMAGFDFDYGGTVVDCGKGRLTYLGCGSSARKLIVRFASDQKPPSREYRQLMGDRVFSSGHPAMQAVNPAIYQLIVAIDVDLNGCFCPKAESQRGLG